MEPRKFRALMGMVMILVGSAFLGGLLFKAVQFTIPVCVLDGFLFVGGYLLIDPNIAHELADMIRAWKGGPPSA